MAITGESVPRTVRAGDDIISGCIVKDGVLEAKVTKTFSESTVSRILELVENASSRKAESENFITRFARYYTPAVVACAVCLAVIPSLLVGNPSVWIYRALSFLVISCPCALVISIPLSFFGGIGGASSKGILVKGSNYLEALASADTVVFDKTGTLTKGVFEVSDLVPSESFALESGSREEAKSGLLKLASLAESYSNHPIALSITDAAKERGIYDSEAAAKIEPDNIKELSGRGISAVINGDTVLCGNRKLMDSEKVNMEKADEYSGEGTCVFLAYSGKYAGRIIISDEIRPDSVKCIKGLKDLSITAVMLTGDRKRSADAVSEKLGIDMVYSELLPSDKVDITEKLLDKEQNGNKLAFVGDGINDAPVLARADIGVAMGGVGSDAAIEASDIVLMTDEPSKLIEAVKISKKTLRIVKENIVFAIGIKVLILILAAFGIASMWAAVFADVGVAVIAILNAMRAMRV